MAILRYDGKNVLLSSIGVYDAAWSGGKAKGSIRYATAPPGSRVDRPYRRSSVRTG